LASSKVLKKSQNGNFRHFTSWKYSEIANVDKNDKRKMIRTRRISVPKTFISYFLSSGVLNVFRTLKNFYSDEPIDFSIKWTVKSF